MAQEQHLLTEIDGHVAIIKIHRPKVLNALNLALMEDLATLLEQYDDDDSIYVILLSGGEKAWAAGADIGDMASADADEMRKRNQFATWERIKAIQKPIVAAVSGFALGGGCELMMHCDIVVASDNAKFGQPEINIGVMPGAGGTQRLTHAVGKAAAMDIVLSGRFLNATEAYRMGLISRIVPKEFWFEEALAIAQQVATKGPVALRAAKASVLNANEMSLSEGLTEERQLFYSLFDTKDQEEGMSAFLEKRSPNFKGE